MMNYLRCFMLLTVLALFSGCQTLHGMGEDVHNASNPDLNGWNTLKKADSWMQENLW